MRRLVSAAVVLLAAVALGGCSDDGPDPGDPMSTWTPTSKPETPTATTDPLTDPPADETARQFIRRWVALGDEMQASGETSSFLAVSGPDCTPCREYAKRIRRVYRAGGSIVGGESTVRGLRHDGASQWTVTLTSSPTTIKDTSTAEPRELDGGEYGLVVYVSKVDGQWVLATYEDQQ